MNGVAILLSMIAIYGWYAVKDPRVATLGRKNTVYAWLSCSVAALGITISFDLAKSATDMVFVFVMYGVVMTIFLEEARVVRVSSPLLLAVHGMGLADVDALLVPAFLLTPLVLYAVLRRRSEGLLDCLLYVWCTVVLTVYTVRFIQEGLFHTDELSTLLLALPLLIVRLSSLSAMLIQLIDDLPRVRW